MITCLNNLDPYSVVHVALTTQGKKDFKGERGWECIKCAEG